MSKRLENIWKSCLAMNTNTKDNVNSENCSWWINSPEHNNCFWKYIKSNSDWEGKMSELSQAELAELFGWSSTKMYFAIKEAMIELEKAFKENDAHLLLRQFSHENNEEYPKHRKATIIEESWNDPTSFED